MQDNHTRTAPFGCIATIVFVLIMIPVIIAALNVLNIPAVSQPAANMLNGLLTALPAIFGAFLILANRLLYRPAGWPAGFKPAGGDRV